MPNNDIRDIFETEYGEMLVATNGGGVCRMSYNGDIKSIVSHSNYNQQSLSNNSVYAVFEDADKVLWIGTYAGGINFNAANISSFSYIRQQHFPPGSFIGSRIRSLYVDVDQNIWFGSWSGVNVLNPRTQSLRSYRSDGSIGHLSPNTAITSIFQDSRGWYWIGTYSGGINLLKKGSSEFVYFQNDPRTRNSLSSNNVYCFEEDKNGDMWIGTSSGLNKYSVRTNTFESYLDEDIRDIKITKDGSLYLGILGGIAFFNPQSTFFRTYEEPGFDFFPVTQLYIENDETIWFSTQGTGMGKLQVNSGTYTVFHEADGLPSEYVSSLVAVGDSIIWLSTYKGISKFDIKNKSFTNYGLSSNLPGLEYYPRSSAILPNGDIAFGGSRGLVFFNPRELEDYCYASPVIISKLRIKNAVVEIGEEDSPLTQSIIHTNEIHLKNSQKDVSFDFLSFNYKSPGENTYSYKLENYIDDWIDVGALRSIPFTNLDPGEYVFKVRLNGNKVSKAGKIAAIKIKVDPPYYFSWWFILLNLMFVGGLIWLYGRFRVISAAQKKQLALERIEYEKQKQFHQMRLRFFANISHELRTPLTLINGPVQTLMLREHDTESERLLGLISRSTKRLLKLVDQILDFRKMENDALKLKVAQLDINKSIENIFNAFNELASQKKIEYSYNSEIVGQTGWFDSDKLEKICYNIISNAFKFTPENGKIDVTLTEIDNGDSLAIVIKDSGKGVSEEKLNQIFERYYSSDSNIDAGGTGIGLAVVKKLIELHHGKIEVVSENDLGSTFTITLPFKKASYSKEEMCNDNVGQEKESVAVEIDDMPDSSVLLPHKVDDKSPLILVVEDEVDLRAYLKDILSKSYRVIDAENGEDGYAQAVNHIPNLILSDVAMPVVDGIQFCNMVNNNDKISHVPFVFLSAWSSDEFKMRGLGSGAIDYIPKPFNAEEILIKIKNIIDTRKNLEAKSKKKFNLDPKNVVVESVDDEFLKKIQDILETHIDDPDFTSKKFMQEMNMSHSLLYRKLKELTGFSSNEFIRDYRLKRAAQIISQNAGLSILEVGIRTGFNDPKYFSQRFKKKFGINPSEFAKLGIEEQGKIIEVSSN